MQHPATRLIGFSVTVTILGCALAVVGVGAAVTVFVMDVVSARVSWILCNGSALKTPLERRLSRLRAGNGPGKGDLPKRADGFPTSSAASGGLDIIPMRKCGGGRRHRAERADRRHGAHPAGGT